MIKVAETKINGGELIVVIEGDSVDEANSADARKLAYETRLEKGFSNAGIEAIGGPYMHVPEGSDDRLFDERKWRKDFRLKPSI